MNQKSVKGWVLLHGSHDGYKRLSNAVTHERTIYLEKGTRILIKDSFRGQGYHDFELNFHLHPDAVVEEGDGWITTHMGGVKTFIQLAEAGSFEVIRGREEPIHGWYSRAYVIKLPSSVLSCRTRKQAGEARFVTVVSLGGPCDVNELINRFRQIEQIVNWLGDYTFDKALEILERNKDWKENVRKKLATTPAFSQIPIRLWKQLTHFIGEKNWGDVSKSELRKLASELTEGEFQIQGKGQFKEEFVTCGGVSLKEVDFKTMQSRVANDLFFAGEVLDIDGITGGSIFNRRGRRDGSRATRWETGTKELFLTEGGNYHTIFSFNIT